MPRGRPGGRQMPEPPGLNEQMSKCPTNSRGGEEGWAPLKLTNAQVIELYLARLLTVGILVSFNYIWHYLTETEIEKAIIGVIPLRVHPVSRNKSISSVFSVRLLC